jgi:hypothetical protein
VPIDPRVESGVSSRNPSAITPFTASQEARRHPKRRGQEKRMGIRFGWRIGFALTLLVVLGSLIVLVARESLGLGSRQTAPHGTVGEVDWPDGTEEAFPGRTADQVVVLRKGEGQRVSP